MSLIIQAVLKLFIELWTYIKLAAASYSTWFRSDLSLVTLTLSFWAETLYLYLLAVILVFQIKVIPYFETLFMIADCQSTWLSCSNSGKRHLVSTYRATLFCEHFNLWAKWTLNGKWKFSYFYTVKGFNLRIWRARSKLISIISISWYTRVCT